jgi:hypothetical protein
MQDQRVAAPWPAEALPGLNTGRNTMVAHPRLLIAGARGETHLDEANYLPAPSLF